LRFFHEQNTVYEKAFTDQIETTQQRTRLDVAAHRQLVDLLDMKTIDGLGARCMLQHVDQLQQEAQTVEARLPEMARKTNTALKSSRAAQQAYAQQVQTHFKLTEASRRFTSDLRRRMQAKIEEKAAEDYSFLYVAKPQGEL
jgi:hypothetical protein